MVDEPATPFDSLEAALEYVGLLGEALEEARTAIGEDIALARAEDATRRIEALQLVTYKLDRLSQHVGASRRLLNDLRTLRRLLMGEREEAPEAVAELLPVESYEVESGTADRPARRFV
jgi:hypothetical protein